MRVSPRSLAMSLLAVLLVIDALSILVTGVLGLGFPQQLDYGESIVYGQASRIMEGEALYQRVGQLPYTITAYTPLYYAVSAGLQVTLGPGFIWGRMASLLAALVTTLLIAYLAAAVGKSAYIGVLAAGIFLTFGFPDLIPWFALYRVDMLGVALSIAAIVTLSGGPSKPRLVAAGCLAGLALLTKQTLFAATLTGLVWLWPMGWRRPCLFGGTVALVVGCSSAVLEITTKSFIANTIWANANPVELSLFFSHAAQLIFNQLLPVSFALFFLSLSHPWRTPRTRLLMLYWMATALPVIGIAKVGANHNYWIEFAASTAVLAANGIWLAAERTSRHLRDGISIALLCLILLEAGGFAWIELGGGLASVYHYVLDARRQESDFDALVARVRAEPKMVLADPLDVVVLANRPIEFEPLIYNIFLRQGSWDPQPLVEGVCRGDVGLLVLGQPIEKRAEAAVGDYSMWPTPVLTALTQRMVLEGTEAGRFVYVPRLSTETPPICRASG